MATLDIIFLAIIFIISISLHEYAHARASVKLGDPTPKIQGRLTPNPIAHIDPLGFVLIFVINFGRGRPVQVNPAYYKNTLRDELLVALAGPISNLILASMAVFITFLYISLTGIETIFSHDIIIKFRTMFGQINVALALFNLLPIYPLDGYRIIKYIFPSLGYQMERYRTYFVLILLFLIFIPGLLGFPNILGSLISSFSSTIYGWIHAFWGTFFLL